MDKVLTFIANVSDLHGLVAQEICFFIVEEHESMDVNLTRDVVKSLSALVVEDEEVGEVLRENMGDVEIVLAEKGVNKTTTNNLSRFAKRLEAFLEKKYKDRLVEAAKAAKKAEMAEKAREDEDENMGTDEKLERLSLEGDGAEKKMSSRAKKAPLAESNFA